MSGEQILPYRLPPSGALILDAYTQQALRAGSGTPGLEWRGEYSGAGVDIGGAYGAPIAIAGLGGTWSLPAGYWYDIEFSLTIGSGAGTTVNHLVAVVTGLPTVGLMALATWGYTALHADEENTYMNGRVRFYAASDITSVSLLVGASGSAGDRLLTGGFLRIEQYTEGGDPQELKLNSSGSFLEDATTNVPAQVGTGTPGFVFRADASLQAPLDIGGTTPQLVPGLAQAWEMLAGYHYDIEYFATIVDAAAGTTGDLVLLVEGSTNGGSSWFTMKSTTLLGTVVQATEAREYFSGIMSYIPAVDITNIRCSAAGGIANRNLTSAWVKAEQYVR